MSKDNIAHIDKVKARPHIESYINRMSKFDHKTANLTDSAKTTLRDDYKNMNKSGGDRRSSSHTIENRSFQENHEDIDEDESDEEFIQGKSDEFSNNFSKQTENSSFNSTNITFSSLNENSNVWDSQFSNDFSGRGSTPLKQHESHVSSTGLHQKTHSEGDKNTGISKIFAYFSIGILILGLFIHISSTTVTESSVENTVNIENQIREKLDILIEQYPKQNKKIWATIHAGIQDVIELNQPSTFLLIHKNARDTASSLAKNIAKIAVNILNTKYPDPLELQANDLNTNELISDHGKFILKYRAEIEKRGAIVIYNLEQLNAEVARAFHNLCDNITPLVPKSIIIFTLAVEEDNFNEKETYIAEKRLTEIWSAMKEDIRRPLITRLTGRIIKIVAE